MDGAGERAPAGRRDHLDRAAAESGAPPAAGCESPPGAGYVVDGQIWLGNTLAAQLGIDVDAITTAPTTQRDRLIHDATRAVPAVVEARAHGVFLGPRDGDSLGRWTRLSREGDANGIRLGIIAAMNPAQGEPRLLTGDPTSAQLARRIGLFSGSLGFPFRHSAASTGLDLMMALR